MSHSPKGVMTPVSQETVYPITVAIIEYRYAGSGVRFSPVGWEESVRRNPSMRFDLMSFSSDPEYCFRIFDFCINHKKCAHVSFSERVMPPVSKKQYTRSPGLLLQQVCWFWNLT